MHNNLILVDELTSVQIASICDHSFLATYQAFSGKEQDPRELRVQNFRIFLDATVESERVPYSVVVLSDLVPLLREYLDEHGRTDIKVAAAVWFPYGSVHTDLKVTETKAVIALGAVEIDVVLNYQRLLAGDVDYARDDIKAVADATQEKGAVLKVIIETSKLSADQIKTACHLADEAGADFVKTTSGGWQYGARAEDLVIMRENFSRGVKLSGPMESADLRDLLRAASGRTDGYIDFDPAKVRIGEGTSAPYVKPNPAGVQPGEGTFIDRV